MINPYFNTPQLEARTDLVRALNLPIDLAKELTDRELLIKYKTKFGLNTVFNGGDPVSYDIVFDEIYVDPVGPTEKEVSQAKRQAIQDALDTVDELPVFLDALDGTIVLRAKEIVEGNTYFRE